MSVRQLFDLTGRAALITGGSRGLGLAMAHALGEMGAKLAIKRGDKLVRFVVLCVVTILVIKMAWDLVR